jgi:hypothetical protein
MQSAEAPEVPGRSAQVPWLWILLGLVAISGAVYDVRKKRR